MAASEENLEEIVANYRDVITKRESATDTWNRAEFESLARRMRLAWSEWQGEDSLHEMAFGEPDE
jgi:hypothetical protein